MTDNKAIDICGNKPKTTPMSIHPIASSIFI
jgi:hypothetical protein